MPPTQKQDEPLTSREVDQIFADIREIKNSLKEITGLHAKEIADMQKEIAGLRVEIVAVKDMQKEMAGLRIELAAVKVKMAIIATIGSLIGSGIITFAVNMLKDTPK